MDASVRAICFVGGEAGGAELMGDANQSHSFDGVVDFEAWRQSIAETNIENTTETMHSLFTVFSEEWKEDGFLPMNYFY